MEECIRISPSHHDDVPGWKQIQDRIKQSEILNRKNMRAKVSYTLSLLERNGLIAVRHGERGKLKTDLTPIGKELLESIIS